MDYMLHAQGREGKSNGARVGRVCHRLYEFCTRVVRRCEGA